MPEALRLARLDLPNFQLDSNPVLLSLYRRFGIVLQVGALRNFRAAITFRNKVATYRQRAQESVAEQACTAFRLPAGGKRCSLSLLSAGNGSIMNFTSDNWAGASEPIIEALAAAARDGGPAYGGDALTRRVSEKFSEIFEREVAVFLVGSGTFANSLSLSAFARPGGVVVCHRQGHINTDEAGAAEALCGLKLATTGGREGKLTAEGVADVLARYPAGNVHFGRPVAVNITQLTESGTAYTPEEVAAISALAKARGAALHMDGSRFGNAIATLGVSPAEMTWRAGVDVLSFGGTKNGCIAGEAVIFFNPADAADAGLLRQRAGHGFSKNWFIAAQFDAYLANGHWLELAAHANAMAAGLAAAIEGSGNGRLVNRPAGNEVFAAFPHARVAGLRAAGGKFYEWSPEDDPAGEGETVIRLVTNWQTSLSDVEAFGAALASA